MRITGIREKTFSIASPTSNAYIDFRKMTCSVVAVQTDVVRDGKPVVGFGFNSNGRYAPQGLLRERTAIASAHGHSVSARSFGADQREATPGSIRRPAPENSLSASGPG